MTATFADPVRRHEGDHGVEAAVYVDLFDGDGEPITSGAPRLVVASLISGPFRQAGVPLVEADLAHVAGPTWTWVPGPGDLRAGLWRMTVAVGDVIVPRSGYGTMRVAPDPAREE